MTNTTTTRVDRTPSHNDLAITNLVHRALSTVRDAGRFGDRKVFIASLWTTMLAIEAATGGTLTEGCTIAHFKTWLLGAMRLTIDGIQGGAPLVVLCRADLVAAMDPALVAASETVTNGASFHFVVDPAVGHTEYAPRIQHAAHTANGGVGKVSARRRAA